MLHIGCGAECVQAGCSSFFLSHNYFFSFISRLWPEVVFHWKSSSIEGRLPPKVDFHRRSSSTGGCLPLYWQCTHFQNKYMLHSSTTCESGASRKVAMDSSENNFWSRDKRYVKFGANISWKSRGSFGKLAPGSYRVIHVIMLTPFFKSGVLQILIFH